MDIPKIIKIGSREIIVNIKKLDNNFLGEYLPDKQEINLSKDNSPSVMIEVFWHELIHAINDYNRIENDIANEMEAVQNDKSDPELRALNFEERLTDNFAKVFLNVITENKLLNLTL